MAIHGSMTGSWSVFLVVTIVIFVRVVVAMLSAIASKHGALRFFGNNRIVTVQRRLGLVITHSVRFFFFFFLLVLGTGFFLPCNAAKAVALQLVDPSPKISSHMALVSGTLPSLYLRNSASSRSCRTVHCLEIVGGNAASFSCKERSSSSSSWLLCFCWDASHTALQRIDPSPKIAISILLEKGMLPFRRRNSASSRSWSSVQSMETLERTLGMLVVMMILLILLSTVVRFVERPKWKCTEKWTRINLKWVYRIFLSGKDVTQIGIVCTEFPI